MNRESDKILNPKTNRLVSKTGSIGRSIIATAKSTSPAKSASPKSSSKSSASNTTFDDIPNNVKRLILQNAETAKAMRASTKKYEDLVKTKLNNKFWLKEYLKEKFSKKSGTTYKLKLIPSEQSKLPTLDIEARTYCTGDTLLQVKNGNKVIFTKISPIKDENKNASWYAPNRRWRISDDEDKKMFTDVLQNLTKVNVASAENSELIKSWNKNLSAKTKKI